MTTVLRRKAKAKAEPEVGEPAVPRRSPANDMLALLACAVLVVAAACIVLWRQSVTDKALEQAREQGLAAAQSSAKDLLSYNYKTLDFDLQKAKSEMTPAMAASFSDYWRVFRPSVEKSQTQALTQVQVAGVTRATSNRVEVVLFVKMISVNAAHKEPQVDTSWPRLQMVKVGKRWLIDGPRMTTPPPAAPNPSPSSPQPKQPGPKPSK